MEPIQDMEQTRGVVVEHSLVKPSPTGYACLVASNPLEFTVTLQEGAEYGGTAPVDIESAEVVATAHSEERSHTV